MPKTKKKLKAITRRIADNLLIDLDPMYRGLNDFRDIPLAKAKKKMKARGFAAQVDAWKQEFKNRGMPAGKAEAEIAHLCGLTVDTLRKRLQRAK